MTTAGTDFMAEGAPDQTQAVEEVERSRRAPGVLVQRHLEQQEGPGRDHHRRRSTSLVAIFAPLIAPYSPDRRVLRPAGAAVRESTCSGTNVGGQDIFSQLIYGARVSLLVGLLGGTLATADRPGDRDDLRLHRGHHRRRRLVLLHQRRAGHPGAAVDHHPGRLLRGPRHRADRRRHRDHLLGRRGPRQAGADHHAAQPRLRHRGQVLRRGIAADRVLSRSCPT